LATHLHAQRDLGSPPFVLRRLVDRKVGTGGERCSDDEQHYRHALHAADCITGIAPFRLTIPRAAQLDDLVL